MNSKVSRLNDILEQPSIDHAKKYIKEFDDIQSLNEEAVKRVFKVFCNDSIASILIKVIILNNRYSTRLNDNEAVKRDKKIMPSVTQVAEKIYELESLGRFDECNTKEKTIELVNNFLESFDKKFLSRPYSFITKYCSFRLPSQQVPIVDSYVKGLLYYYNETEKYHYYITKFKQSKLDEYEFFIEVYESFVEKYDLSCFSTKNIDKYLWSYAKELANKDYKIQI